MIILILVLTALPFVLLLISMFVSEVPIVLMVIVPVLLLVILIWDFKQAKRKKVVRLLISLLTALTIFVSIVNVWFNPYMNSMSFRKVKVESDYNQVLSSEEAQEDLLYLMERVDKIHPMFIKDIPDEVEKAYNHAKAEIDMKDTITLIEFYHLVTSVLSPLSDAHTTCWFNNQQAHYYKYIFDMQNKGYNIMEVNGMSAESILEENRNWFSYESQEYVYYLIERKMLMIEGLLLLDISIDEPIIYTFVNDIGETIYKNVSGDDFTTYEGLVDYYGEEYMTERTSSKRPFVSYEIDREKSLAILYLDSCQYNDTYKQTLETMFQEVENYSIENVVVDLRRNSGGNSLVANEFIRYLPVDTYKSDTYTWRTGPALLNIGDGKTKNKQIYDKSFDGQLYVLTATKTFSSAMMFAQYIGDNNIGTIIGERPGNAANGYGEIVSFQLPKSKLMFSISSKRFSRADSTLESDYVEPDIKCDSEDCFETLYGLLEQGK